MLVIKTNKNTKVHIGGITLIASPAPGGQVRLVIDAPRDIPVSRETITRKVVAK